MKLKSKKKNEKGFTLVELLAVVVILGIVSVIGISSVSRLIDKAKQDQRAQQEKTVSMAAESYLQANSNAMPKTIGEAKVVKLSDLKKANYIREDVKNADGESCMDNSYVRVYKYSKSKYTYSPYIYCGKEKVPATTTTPKPSIKVEYFYKDGNGVEHTDDRTVADNVSNAKVRIILTGGKNTDGSSLLLDGYTYSISVQKKDDPTLEEVYNSGTLNAGFEEKLVIEKSLSEYIDITDVTSFSVKAFARNTAGGSLDTEKGFGNKSGSYNDTKAPTCSDITGEAENADSWNTTPDKPRFITVRCNDGEGSQCLRENFSKTWPNEAEPEAEFSWIMIEDNAGNKNTKSCDHGENGCCKVRVNIDYTAPTVKIEAYRRTKNGKTTGENVLKANGANKDKHGWEDSSDVFTANQKDVSYMIASNDYKGITNNWFNNNDFPEGVVYKVTISDTVHLHGWEWSVNASNTAETSALGAGSESDRGSISGSDEKVIYLSFKDDGRRHGRLKVYDRAGNTTVVDIFANLDRVSPRTPNLDDPNQAKIYMTKSDGGNYGSYTFGTWSTMDLRWEINRAFTPADNLNANNYTLSGYSHYNYYFTDQDGKVTPYSTASGAYGMTISSQGIGSFRVNVCDNAGNCSQDTTTRSIKIDTKPPVCTVTGGSTWTYKDVLVTAKCSDPNGKYGSGCERVEDYSFNYNYEINTTNATAIGPDVTLKLKDKAGNEVTCAPVTVQIDKTPPTCAVSGGRDGWTNQALTVTATCTDRGGSECKEPSLSHPYTSAINTATAGANGNNDGGRFYDYAGNYVDCPANQKVMYDPDPPTCTVTGGNDEWTNRYRTVKATCTDTGGSGCTTPSLSTKYDTDIETATAGANGNNSGGRFYDQAGNYVDCPANQTVKVDKTPPTCPTITPSKAANKWTNESIDFEFTFKNTGVVNYNWYTTIKSGKSGSKYAGWTDHGSNTTSTKKKTVSKQGFRKVKMKVYDRANNSKECGGNKEYKIDKSKPTISTLKENPGCPSGNVSWRKGVVRDNLSGFDWDKTWYDIGRKKGDVSKVFPPADRSAIEGEQLTHEGFCSGSGTGYVHYHIVDRAGNVADGELSWG